MRVAAEIVRNEVPYVMLCGGEPLVVPHFFQLAEALGAAGVQLKIETNGQRFDAGVAERLARLPIRSIQVSLDGDTQEVYERQRPGGSLAKAHAACRAARAAGLPLEITFAPTRLNLHEAGAVIRRARELGAFRFNTGQLMRVGTAARHWQAWSQRRRGVERPTALFKREAARGGMEICFEPFSLDEGLRREPDGPTGHAARPAEWLGEGGGSAAAGLRRPAPLRSGGSVARVSVRMERDHGGRGRARGARR